MIVLFIESDLIRQQELPERTCPHCEKAGHTVMDFRQRYAEFGTGKVYPKGVFGVVHCLKCGFTLPASRWDEPLHRAYNGLKADYKTPISYWKGAIRTAAGLVVGVVLLVLVLSVWGHFARVDIDKQQAMFTSALEHPAPGITLACGDGSSTDFYVWRVDRVSSNTVWLKKYTGARKLTNFFTETGWHTVPDRDFASEAVAYSATRYADKCLMGADSTRGCEFAIFAVLDK